MLIYGGNRTDILPNGPSISTVFNGSDLVILPNRGGNDSGSRRLTSGGSDSGAAPILDLHLDVDEKGR